MTVAITLALASCAPAQPRTSQEVSAGVTVRDSQFDSSATFVGPEISEAKSEFMSHERSTYRLRGWRNKQTGELRFQLYAKLWYSSGKWRFYRTASFPDATQRSLLRISAEPSCMSRGGYASCTHEETVGLSLSHQELLAYKDTGLQVRMNSQSGSHTVLTVPPAYIQGFLSAIK